MAFYFDFKVFSKFFGGKKEKNGESIKKVNQTVLRSG